MIKLGALSIRCAQQKRPALPRLNPALAVWLLGALPRLPVPLLPSIAALSFMTIWPNTKCSAFRKPVSTALAPFHLKSPGEMVQGVLARCAADIAVSITGIAGPGGATPTKPVGTCLLRLSSTRGRNPWSKSGVFAGDRYAVRMASVENALDLILVKLAGPRRLKNALLAGR